MNLRYYIFIAVTLFAVCSLNAECVGSGVNVVENDSDPEKFENTEKTKRFYDSLESKSTRRSLPRFLYNTMFIRGHKDTLINTKVVDETEIFSRMNGKKIGEISVERLNVFDDGQSKLEKFANKIHIVTQDKTIRRDLFFKSGDDFNAALMINNEQFLKARNYIYDAKISVTADLQDTSKVNLTIKTQDSWTMSADAGINFGGRSMIELYDANIIGTGSRFSVRTSFDLTRREYGGNRVEYYTPNIFGSFFKGHFIAGKNFDSSDLGFSVKKEFIVPSDYEFGVLFLDSHTPYYMLHADSSLKIVSREISFWGGKSIYIKSMASSLYFTGSYNNMKYGERADVSPTMNPAFHNREEALFGMGLYREKFYTTNLIYGYGVREYIPAGYRAEFIGGYRWGEFASDLYLGAEYSAGGFSRIGYIMGGVALGSYFNPDRGHWTQSSIDIGLRYFSNLLVSGRSKIRQFISISYIRGWNRLEGSDELLTFDRLKGLRGFNDYAAGLNRALLSSETVVFTPLQPLGFKMTFFGFADFGLLGNNVDMFKNSFFSTFGIGVRLKNERLVFSTIQLRLGIAVGKAGLLKNDVFNISNQYNMEKYRYLPSHPETLPYR